MPPLQSLSLYDNHDDDLIEVPIDTTFSDGDRSIWPTHPRFERADPKLYLLKLADMWMKERGEAKKGTYYVLDRLPEGYVYLSRARQQNPELRDKFLYGHPTGAYFNSPNRFWPHFLHLMSHGASQCRCDLCRLPEKKPALNSDGTIMARSRGRQPGFRPESKHTTLPYKPANGAVGKPGRPKVKKYLAEDEEGTPDVFKTLVVQMKTTGSVDEAVKEPCSMDWRAERRQLREHLTRMFMQHSFIPRIGELVLWCYNFKGTELKFNRATDRFEMYCQMRKKYLGIPEWRAGIIAQAAEEHIILEDAIIETEKEYSVNMSGFRVETFPDPNSTDKSLSRQYKYVPLSWIRPLNYWQIFLQEIPLEKYHPSIKNALTIMSSFSLLEKYHFKGKWPNASIHCKGIYIGSELLIKGDGVRLMPRPSSPNQVTDVLVIESIQVILRNCDADTSSPLLCESTAVHLVGKAYTVSPDMAYREPGSTTPPTPLTDAEVIDSFQCVGMRGYGKWYPLQPEGQKYQISLDRVVGRCYESELMMIMFHDLSLGLDLDGVLSGRDYGRTTDQRIAPGKEWFCGDTRVETLALETLNGYEVGRYDDARDMKMFRANLSIIDGTATHADIKASKIPRQMGRPRAGLIGGRKGSLTTFESVGKMSTMVSSALGNPSANDSSRDITSAPASADEEAVDSSESEESEDELAVAQPVFIRGGTEESEGGDYRPYSSNEPKAKRPRLA